MNASNYQMNVSSNQCFILNITTRNGIWQGENPLTEPLPFLVTQLTVILIVSRGLFFLLKPLQQPRIVTDILAGLLLGPTALGKTSYFSDLFPTKNILTVETVAYLALVFHVFLVGLEVDISAIMRSNRKAVTFSLAEILISFAIGIGLFRYLHVLWGQDRTQGYEIAAEGALVWAAALTVTSFPVVAQILSDLKLLHSEFGQLATSIALLGDISGWVVTAVVLPICAGPKNAPYVITSTVAVILICVYVIRPFLVRIIKQTSLGNNNQFSDYYLCFVLVGVVLCAFLTDVTGTHSVTGAFIFGLIMPSTELGNVLIERFDYFVTGLLMPLFFATCGIRVDVYKIEKWWVVVPVLIFICSLKVLIALPVSFLSKMHPKDGIALGLLTSTKGVLAILMVNIGWDKKVLRDDDYTVMVLSIVIMTAIAGPTLANIYKRSKRSVVYKRRTIQRTRGDAEFRILTCTHSMRNVAGIIQLLDVSRATKKNPISVFALHLVELTGRASAMLIVHSTRKSGGSVHRSNYGDLSESDQVVYALGEFEDQNPSITIHPLTALSPLATMHEDICTLAEDKRTAFVILPFHRKLIPTGGEVLEDRDANFAFRSINQNVLANAPCSVGIFIDRGFGAAIQPESSGSRTHKIAIVFIGGPDDREALAYAWRMVGHPEVSLTLMRFVPGDDAVEVEPLDLTGYTSSIPSSRSYSDRQKQLDDEYVNEFRLRTAGKGVHYEEKTGKNAEDLIEELKKVEHVFELYIVGRGEGTASPLTAGILEWSDCPELGAVGDLLATSNSSIGSVLVVQQYVGPGDQEIADLFGSPSMSSHSKEKEIASRQISMGSLRSTWSMGLVGSSRRPESFTKHKRRETENDYEFDTAM